MEIGLPAVATATAIAPIGAATATATSVAATATATATVAAAITTAAATATSVAATSTATITTATAAFAGRGFINANHAAHPFDVLKIVDGFLLGFIIDQLNKSEPAFASGIPVEGQAALLDFAVLAEKIKQVLPFSLEREIADVDGHSIKKPGTDSSDVGNSRQGQ
jgi:hypothetical protein